VLVRSDPGLLVLALVLLALRPEGVPAQRVVNSCFTLHSETEEWGSLPDSVRILIHDAAIPPSPDPLPEPTPRQGGWAMALGRFVSPSHLLVLVPRQQGWLNVLFEPGSEVMEGQAWEADGGRPTREEAWRVEARRVTCPRAR
jgi:hypothetical protein